MSNQSSHGGQGPRRRRGAGREKLAVARRDTPLGPAWELVHPRCSRKRREDIEEVEAMVEAGETEIAHDELVWLLSECPDFLEAHVQLGLIALEDDDAKLARGHFGRPYELVIRALDAAGAAQPLPYHLDGNKPFFQAAKGLVHSLMEIGRKQAAKEVCQRIAQLDPTDPLGIQRIAQR
jgi:tetratricopeptide (TPR) repeat protein